MTRRRGVAELMEVGRSTPVGWRLAAICDDPSLASRAVDALERDGLIVAIEAVGPDVSALEIAGRRPTLLLVHAGRGERELEQTLQWAEKRLPHAVVLVILPRASRYDVGLLLSMGADGLVLERDIDVLLGPVTRSAAAGQVSVPAELRHAIQRPALSHRERQILGLAVAGLTNAQIGRRFFIAESTVKTHLSSAFRRLGVHSRREAAALIFGSDEVLRRSVLASVRLAEQQSVRHEAP